MKNKLTYKGYISYIQPKAETDLLFGKIEGIKDLITFEGANREELKKAFEEAVEDYLFLQSATKGC